MIYRKLRAFWTTHTQKKSSSFNELEYFKISAYSSTSSGNLKGNSNLIKIFCSMQYRT